MPIPIYDFIIAVGREGNISFCEGSNHLSKTAARDGLTILLEYHGEIGGSHHLLVLMSKVAAAAYKAGKEHAEQ